MPNNVQLAINSLVYVLLLALFVGGMYLKVIPQDGGFLLLGAVLTHMGINIPSLASNSASANTTSGGGDNAASH